MNQSFDSPDEIFPIVNEQDEVIGQITRKEANQNPNIIHRAVGVFVFNHNNEILIQKRSKTKDTFPDCWDISVGGHVRYEDDYLNTIIRELTEELGINVQKDDLRFLGKLLVVLPWEKEYWQIYRYDIKEDTNISQNKDEVGTTKFVSLKELKTMLLNQDIKWSDKARQQFQKILFK